MTSRQRPLPYVLYHSPCLDGFGAAYAAWRHFGDNARYIPMSHGETIPELRDGADVYMVDFTFKRPQMLEIAKNHRIVVLDHHKSALEDLVGIATISDQIKVVFDMDKSGARLAWEFFHPMREVPALILDIEDRDLWKFSRLNSKAINAALYTRPYEFDIWHNLMTEPILYHRLIAEGEAILRVEDQQVEALCRHARAAKIDVAGHGTCAFPAVNASYFHASEVGNRLLKMFPEALFAGVYRDTGDGKREWSLRSAEGRLDVSKVAVEYGGGGHRNASGMREDRAFDAVWFEAKTFADYTGWEAADV